MARAAAAAGIKTGVVQDKVYLPGLKKLRKLYEANYFGRILSIKLEFGLVGVRRRSVPSQRVSWNYKKATWRRADPRYVCDWRYVFDRCWGRSNRCRAG